MCSVCKGAYHGPAPIPEEGKWVAVKEIKEEGNQGDLWLHPRHWLVCTSTGCLQAESEREGRCDSGGSCRDNRLYRYDTLCRYGQ